MTKFDPMLVSRRMMIDHHNAWVKEHPRAQRRSRATESPPVGKVAFLVALLASRQIVEAHTPVFSNRGNSLSSDLKVVPPKPQPTSSGRLYGPVSAKLRRQQDDTALTTPKIASNAGATAGPVAPELVTPSSADRERRSGRTHFRTISEIKKDILNKLPLETRVRFMVPFNGKLNGSNERWLLQKAHEEYHRQFDEYIKAIPQIARRYVVKAAASRSISEEILNKITKNIFSINKITLYSASIPGVGRELTRNINMPAYVVDIGDHKYLFISPEGHIKKLKTNVAESNNIPRLLNLLNISLKDFNGYRFFSADVTGKANTENISVRHLAEERAQKHITNHIQKLREEHEPSEWSSRLKVIEEILEDTALVLTVAAIPVLGPEELAVEAGVEAIEAAEVVEESAAQVSRAVADARAGLAEALPGTEDFAAPEILDEEVAPAVEDLNEVREADILQRCRRGNLCSGQGELGAFALEQSGILNRAYAQVAAKHHVTPQFIAAFIDSEAAEEIPEFLYRGQAGTTIRSSWGAVVDDNLDDYLVALLKHTGNTRGGEGVSLSMVRSVAKEFASTIPNGKILRIETSFDRANFRSAADLIRNEGPRLVAEGKLEQETLTEAIDNMVVASKSGLPEKEVFYLRGSIPDERIHSSGVPLRR